MLIAKDFIELREADGHLNLFMVYERAFGAQPNGRAEQFLRCLQETYPIRSRQVATLAITLAHLKED